MYLGLDLGTSGLKALVIDGAQKLVAEASAPLSVTRPHPGWSEQAPADWLTATDRAMAELSGQCDLSGIAGIGLSGQMHGAVVIDTAGDVLRPCILWNDTRSADQAARLDAMAQFRATSGNIVFPGFTAPKLLWLAENEVENFEATATVLLPKDYLRLWLTGEAVSEMSDAAGTAWLDTARRDWSEALLAATGLTRAHMPRLVEGSEVSGQLRPEIARKWGMRPNIPVAGGGGDNAATAIGTGVTKPGDAFVSLGTSGVIFAATDSYRPAPETAVHSFCHAVPSTWHQMGVILSCSDALNWYGALVGQEVPALTAGLGAVAPPGRALFLPYLGGERTPHNDAQIRGAFLGLDHGTDSLAGARAVLEGVSFAMKDSLDALAATGTEINRLLAVGGGSASLHWLEMLANALAMPIDLPETGEFGAAFGAARLGLMAASGQSDIAHPPPIARTIAPDPALSDAFGTAHQRYKATYAAIRELS